MMIPEHMADSDLVFALENILYQLRDGTPIDDVTWYDERDRTDYGVEEILAYIDEHYYDHKED